MADRALTDAQRRAASIVLQTLEDDGFVLAGGAALVASGISVRPTRDIDVFTPRPVDAAAAAARVENALNAAGFDAVVRRADREFATLVVSAGRRRSQFTVDLSRDSIEWPPVDTSLGPTLSLRELAANKVLALFGRIETRDLSDLHALAAHVEIDGALHDALTKDAGFDPTVLAEMVERVIDSSDSEWPAGADVAAVRRFGRALVTSLRPPA